MAGTANEPRIETEAVAREAEGTRRANIRGDILAAAARLIAEKGESFTTQELTQEAGVALQTFYRHFGSKDQLMLAVIEGMISGHCANLEAQARHIEDPTERLHLYISGTLQLFRQAGDSRVPQFVTSQHWRLLQIDPAGVWAATQPFADLVHRELEAARIAGRLHPRDPAVDAWMIMKLVMAVFHHYAFVGEDPRLATVAEDVWQFCLAAMSDRTERKT
jgi:TetR/AcrR family transcriptional regulator